jgi:hypothetical protein
LGLFPEHDDLKPDMYVAVHSFKGATNAAFSRRMREAGAPTLTPPESIHPVPRGVPLKVLATSLPYVACGVLNPGGGFAGPVILDIRRERLCRLTRDFVEAITAFETQEENEELSPEQAAEMAAMLAAQAHSNDEDQE